MLFTEVFRQIVEAQFAGLIPLVGFQVAEKDDRGRAVVFVIVMRKMKDQFFARTFDRRFAGAAQDRREAAAFDGFGQRGFEMRQLGNRRQQINASHARVRTNTCFDAGAANDQRHANAAFQQRAFAIVEWRVYTPVSAVIGGVNHVGVIGNAKFIQFFKQQANVDVYIFSNGGVGELKVIDAAPADGSDGFRSRIFHTAAT